MILWYHQISQNFLYQKIDFMISKNRICDITKSWRFFGITIFLYISQNRFSIKKIRFIFLYHKIDFVISKIDLVVLNLILCIQVSFRILSITTFNCQKPKAQIYICICELFRFRKVMYGRSELIFYFILIFWTMYYIYFFSLFSVYCITFFSDFYIK